MRESDGAGPTGRRGQVPLDRGGRVTQRHGGGRKPLPKAGEKGAGAKKGSPRRGFRVLLGACLLASLAALVWVYLFTGVLEVRRIEVEGNRRLGEDYLRAISGITPGTHLLKVDAEAVKRALLAEPYVERVEVRRRFPDTVVIKVTERIPVGCIDQNGRYHLVDRNGVVLESAESPLEGIPMLTGLVVGILFPGAQVVDPHFGDLAVLLEEIPEELREGVEVAGYGEGDGYHILVSGTRVIFGSAEEFRRKAEIALAAIRDLSPRYGPLSYVDVTYPEHPAIKPR
ncbi:MAG: cell division protein FtsQ/DivIB [Actinomycetota bacterium]